MTTAYTEKLTYICPACGSHDTFKASSYDVTWDGDRQAWAAGGLECVHCTNCGDEFEDGDEQ